MSRLWPGLSQLWLKRLREPSSFLLKLWKDFLEIDRLPKVFSAEFRT